MQTHSVKQCGFTMVELIMVIVLIAILSATALPRFFDRSSFETRAFFDDTLNAVRFAKKQAVSSGCKVRVTFSNNGYSLIHEDNCDSNTFDNTRPVKQPNSSEHYASSTTNISVTASHNTTTFDSLGQADTDNQISIGGRTITVVSATGFVYDSTP